MAPATTVLKRILMCRPTFFKVSYSINPWMDINNAVNNDRAMKQWESLKASIERSGASVEVLEPSVDTSNSYDFIDFVVSFIDADGKLIAVGDNTSADGQPADDGAERFPDIVFTANAAVIRKKTAYLANFYYPERQGERMFYEKWLREHGYETVGDRDIPFEGAGDALWGGRDKSVLFVGVGPRTDVRALSDVADKLDDGSRFKVLGCRLVDPRFYHIDTCFCPIDNELAMFYPYAFDSITRHNISNETELIPVPEEDAKLFACNAVVIGKTIIMHKCSSETVKQLGKHGFDVNFTDMSEFLKSGGSAKCCTLEL